MCGPILGIVGAVAGAAGSIMSGMQQASSLRQQAAYNERQAVIEKQRGEYESQRKREEAQRVLGRQRASYLSAGVSLEGTPEEIIIDTTAQSELDVAAIRWGADINASNYQAQARINRSNASGAMMGGVVGAISPVVNAFSGKKSTNLGNSSFSTQGGF